MIGQKSIIGCDRCPKKAELYPADVSAYYDRVMHRIRDYSKQNPDTGDDYIEYDLCADCYAKFTHFMGHVSSGTSAIIEADKVQAMNLNEAINHAEEKTRELRAEAEQVKDIGEIISNPKQPYNEPVKACLDCAREYEQIAEWLKDLKYLREQTRF